MQTRSQTPKFNVEIDFDEASRAWNSNKKRVGTGTYVYICEHVFKNGNSCKNERLNNCLFCKTHMKR
jgi:hypothetical protein